MSVIEINSQYWRTASVEQVRDDRVYFLGHGKNQKLVKVQPDEIVAVHFIPQDDGRRKHYFRPQTCLETNRSDFGDVLISEDVATVIKRLSKTDILLLVDPKRLHLLNEERSERNGDEIRAILVFTDPQLPDWSKCSCVTCGRAKQLGWQVFSSIRREPYHEIGGELVGSRRAIEAAFG